MFHCEIHQEPRANSSRTPESLQYHVESALVSLDTGPGLRRVGDMSELVLPCVRYRSLPCAHARLSLEY